MKPDRRYAVMLKRFRALQTHQLYEVKNRIDLVLFDTHNYHDGKFCPIAVALGCHWRFPRPTDELVKKHIAEVFEPVNILKGVPGDFYHGSDEERKRDLLRLIDQVLRRRGEKI